MCSGLKGCAGKRCLQLQLGSQRCSGHGQPWEHLWIPAHPSCCCCSELWLTLLGRCSVTAAGSWCFQHQVMEEDEWAGIWGALHIIFQVVLITVLCSAVILVSHWILIFQTYFLQQFWPEAVLIVSLQLICQGQTSLLAFLVIFHKEFMETQAPKNTRERTLRWSAKVMCACCREQVHCLLNSGALEFDPDE